MMNVTRETSNATRETSNNYSSCDEYYYYDTDDDDDVEDEKKEEKKVEEADSENDDDDENQHQLSVREILAGGGGSGVEQIQPTTVDDSSYRTSLYFFSQSASTLKQEGPYKHNFLSSLFQHACSSPAFVQFSERYGLLGATFTAARQLRDMSVMEEKFYNLIHHQVPDTATLGIVFHGTAEHNIDNILQQGLDPARRSGQAYGPGEYFGVEPGISTGYCKGGHKMLVFVVVAPDSVANGNTIRNNNRPPPEMVVVENNNHQIPIGVVKFREVSHDAQRRSQAARAKIQQLVAAMEKASHEAQIAEVKAKIIQLLFINEMETAANLYHRNKDALTHDSKREISMYVHKRFETDFVTYYFPHPTLPTPMTSTERDEAVNIRTVEQLREDEQEQRRKLELEVHNNNNK